MNSSTGKVQLRLTHYKGWWTSAFRSQPNFPTLLETLIDMYAGRYYCVPHNLLVLGLPKDLSDRVMSEIASRKRDKHNPEEQLEDLFGGKVFKTKKKVVP
jgi:hypothetical protein